MRTAPVAVLLAVLAAACSSGAASVAQPQRILITTEREPSNVCMQALITGVLVPHAVWGLALQTPGTGELAQPIFPFGYSAAIDAGRIALIDERGFVIARSGDLIQSSGGSIGGEGNPQVVLCDDTIEVVPG